MYLAALKSYLGFNLYAMGELTELLSKCSARFQERGEISPLRVAIFLYGTDIK